MTGKPVGQNLTKIKKMMVSSVYCQMVNNDIRVKVFVTNSFLDSVEVRQDHKTNTTNQLHSIMYMYEL